MINLRDKIFEGFFDNIGVNNPEFINAYEKLKAFCEKYNLVGCISKHTINSHIIEFKSIMKLFPAGTIFNFNKKYIRPKSGLGLGIIEVDGEKKYTGWPVKKSNEHDFDTFCTGIILGIYLCNDFINDMDKIIYFNKKSK